MGGVALIASVEPCVGLRYLVCVCACLSVSSNLPSRAITYQTRDTNGISVI